MSPQGGARQAAPSIQRPGRRPAPLATSGPLPCTGGFSAGTKPVMRVLTVVRDSIPCEDPVGPGSCVSTLSSIGCQAGGSPGLGPTRAGDMALLPTSRARYTTNTTVSNALKIYFWGNSFLNIVEYTGSLQGNNAFKTLFFFLRKGLVYLLRSVFLNNLWTREAPTDLLPFSSSLAARLGRSGVPSP